MAASDLKTKVLEWLDDMFKGVELLDTGGILVPHFGSTALFVDVDDVFDGKYTRVRVDAPVLMDVPVTDELLAYIGMRSNSFLFGGFALMMETDSARTGILSFRQTLLGDALDRVELEVATNLVALTADDLDDNLQRRFGGRRFYQ